MQLLLRRYVLSVLLAAVLTLITAMSHAADLYRMRMLQIADLYPGCTTDVSIICDHTRWPAPPPRTLAALFKR